MTDGWRSLNNFRMRASDQAINMIRGLELSASPHPPGRREGSKIESVTNSQWFNKSSLCSETIKNPWVMRFRELLSQWTHWGAGRVACPERAWKPHSPTSFPAYLALGMSSIWLFLNCFLYGTSVTKTLSSVPSVMLANYQTCGGLIAGWSEVQVAFWSGPSSEGCHLKWGQACGAESLPCGIWCSLQVDSIRIELLDTQ